MRKFFIGITVIVFIMSPVSGSIAAPQEDVANETGPTIVLDYGNTKGRANSARDFMYFVPIVSPTLIECQTSRANTQTARLISFRKELVDDGFLVQCEFEMKGKGYHKNRYLPASMIDKYSVNCKGKTLKNMLDYIVVEGGGYGSIEVSGNIVNGTEVVNDVKIHFNGRGCKSPVRIGLYNVKRANGKFDYADRCHEMIVRVNTLAFKRSDEDAKMGVVVASITKARKKEGLWARFVGAVANLFIPPVEIDPVGNRAMLDFGHALCKQEKLFTFPKAKNLVDSSHEMANKTSDAGDVPRRNQAGLQGK